MDLIFQPLFIFLGNSKQNYRAMSNSKVSSIFTLVVFILSAPAQALAADTLVVDGLVVAVIDSVDVPVNQTGVITQLDVREGNTVKAGQLIGKLDDRKARMEQSLAKVELQIATENAENRLSVELAAKRLAQQEQLVKQHEIVHEIAIRRAQNETRILASKKAEDVTKNELDRATLARQQYVDSVSKSEIDGLRLAYERTRLETKQADFDRAMEALHANAERETVASQHIEIEELRIAIAQADVDARVNRLQAELESQQSQLADLAVERHQIISPIDGVVVERMRSKGDWVTAGDPVVRVVRLNRLRAEGFVTTDKLAALRSHRTVELEVHAGGGTMIRREGRIVFISPEIDPVNEEVRFWVEFDNSTLDVLPGMRLSLKSK